MIRPSAVAKRILIFAHRWMGVALSLLFFLWFVSGIVMMYWGFPGVRPEDRLERAPTLDSSQIKLTAEQAYASLNRKGEPSQALLTTFDGRPVYRFANAPPGRRLQPRAGGRPEQLMVYADTGEMQRGVDAAMLDRIAAAWAKLPVSMATKVSVKEVDQWTVAGQLRTLRPMYKYSFKDGQQIYISGLNGEVVQYTTSSARFWAYLGAIPHWIYFTPLRKHQPEWSQVVIWTSGIGTIAALLGIVIAVWMYSPAKRYRYAGAPSSIPYRGWKRWHTIVGLAFGVITATWCFSGMLSMGPFEFLERMAGNRPVDRSKISVRANKDSGERSREFNLAAALQGGDLHLADFREKLPDQAIASIHDFQPRQLELTVIAGEPTYIATNASGTTRIVPLHGEPRDRVDPKQIEQVVRNATRDSSLAEVRIMNDYDAYYLDRNRRRPLPVVYVLLNDQAHTRYYVDPATARIVGNYSSRNWVNRWLYHGLHSLDLPFLYKHRPLWDIVVITLMLGGTALCVTSLILTYQVLARKVIYVLKDAGNHQGRSSYSA
jgi:hypothetical protein